MQATDGLHGSLTEAKEKRPTVGSLVELTGLRACVPADFADIWIYDRGTGTVIHRIDLSSSD